MTSELVTRMTECPFGEGENLLRSDLEDEHFAVEDFFAIAMMKAVDADGVIPTTVPLVRPRFGDANEFLLGFHSVRHAFDHDVETLIPIVAARGEGHVIVVRQIHALLFFGSGSEEQGVIDPHGNERRDVGSPVSTDRGNPKELS